MKTKTYPRLLIRKRPRPVFDPWPWQLCLDRGPLLVWGRYSTAQEAWRVARDLLHNHREV